MRPVHQTETAPGRGNCLAACVASLLELPVDEVPNFILAPCWIGEVQRFLAPRGLGYVMMTADEAAFPDGMIYIASGMGPRGRRHAVLMRDGVLVHDPHPDGGGLVENPDRYGLIVGLGPGACP